MTADTVYALNGVAGTDRAGVERTVRVAVDDGVAR